MHKQQIWWGHRIPAWHDDEGNVYVGYDEKELREFYKLDDRKLTQDEDVLDTWFSSSLWPFGSLAGHKKQQHLKLTFQHLYWLLGLILSFWVARMMMMSLEFTGKIPFKNVYVTGLIRDENGQKMSNQREILLTL